jgi:conjugative transfer region protein TrbK
MRGRSVTIGTVSRVAGFVVVAAAIIVTSILFRHGDISAGPPTGTAATSARNDPLARKLAHCRAIGMAAKDDAACEAAWAENRRRFFTYRQPREASPAVAWPSTTPTADR